MINPVPLFLNQSEVKVNPFATLGDVAALAICCAICDDRRRKINEVSGICTYLRMYTKPNKVCLQTLFSFSWKFKAVAASGSTKNQSHKAFTSRLGTDHYFPGERTSANFFLCTSANIFFEQHLAANNTFSDLF